MAWLGMARMVSATPGEFTEFDDFVDEDTSEPPELEDCSQLLSEDRDEGERPAAARDIKSPIGNNWGAASPQDQNASSRSLRTAGLQAHSLSQAQHPFLRPHVPGAPTPLSPGRRAKDGRDWYVYDPVFGVIPQETRDLWQAQEHDSLQRREATHKRQVPPVRYSQKQQGQS